MQLDRTERRILGALIEKRWSTPDQYPLSMNALLAACNQKSNRDPVLALEDFEVSGCLLGLREKGLILIRERDGGHVQRYAEKLSEELTLDTLGAAIVAELMLRGPQTAPELARRCARMKADADLGGVETTLAGLARERLVMLQARQSSQRLARWTHLLEAEEGNAQAEAEQPVEVTPTPVALKRVVEPVIEFRDEGGVAPEQAPVEPDPAPMDEPADVREDEPEDDLRTEVEELRREVAELRDRVERLESVVL